jgi:hypothetical protein
MTIQLRPYKMLVNVSIDTESLPGECNVDTPVRVQARQWRTQEFYSGGGGSTNSVEDRENGDLGSVAP